MTGLGTFETRLCRVCGCGEYDACMTEDHGACWWVERDLCSACAFEAVIPAAPRAAPFVAPARWAPLPGSMSLAEADAIQAEIWIGGGRAGIARRHGMSLDALDAFVARNGQAPEAA